MKNVLDEFGSATTARAQEILPELLESIRTLEDICTLRASRSVDMELTSTGNTEIGELWSVLGIGLVMMPKSNCESLHAHNFQLRTNRAGEGAWRQFKTPSIVEGLQALLRECAVISFCDWATFKHASELWEGIRYDIIRPLRKTDFNFVFHLGSLAHRSVFDLDEIIDVISDFSLNGRVTLLLSPVEAEQLWRIIRGERRSAASFSLASNHVFRSILDTMHIDRLLIYSHSYIQILSGTQQVEFMWGSRGHVRNAEGSQEAFESGYNLGLLLNQSIDGCVTLGNISSHLYEQHGTIPDRNELMSFLGDATRQTVQFL